MKKLFLSLLITALFILTFAFAVSAKDVDIEINDVNGNSIVLPTVDDEGDALTWYRITEKPNDGIYFEYVDGNTTYYIVSVKTKVAAYVNDSYYLCYSYPGITANAWSGNIIAMNLDGIKHADGNGPQKLNFVFEGTPVAYVYLPASIVSLTGKSGNTEKSLFYAAPSLVELEIESGSKIEELNTNGFYNCRKLNRFVLPENLKTINANAFVSLTIEITVPKSVTTFEVSNWANFTVHYTGTAEDHAGWAYQPSKIDYVNHCDVYYGGVHQEGEALDYLISCSRCGEAMYCINPEHNVEKTLVYEAYGKAGVLKEQCTECNVGAKETVVPALITFKGYSVNGDSTAVCAGYAINTEAVKLYKEINQTSFEYGVVVALAENVDNYKALVIEEEKTTVVNTSVLQVTIDKDVYSKLDVKIVGDFSGNENTEILMSAYIYDGTEIAYIQGNKQETTQSDQIVPVTIVKLK